MQAQSVVCVEYERESRTTESSTDEVEVERVECRGMSRKVKKKKVELSG